MLQEIDTALFYFINNSMNYPPLDPVMVFVTRKPYIIFAVLLAMLVPGKRTKLILPVLLSLMAFGLSDLTGNFFKHLFERERPFALLEHVNKLVSAGSFAFPSNHAANSFAFATGMVWFFRKAALPFLAVAALVAFSRIYVGVHYPLDVLAGSVLGPLCFFAVLGLYSVVKKIKK